jgi:regulator of replication initiation timing
MSTTTLRVTAVFHLEETLNDLEKDELAQHEAVINRNAPAVFETAKALAAIRDFRLYRETHKTFEAYCSERWGITRHHANRMIAGAAVAKDLEPIGSIPKNLEQTKPLARLDSNQRREAWKIARERSGDKEPTGAELEHAAKVVAPPKPKRVETEEEKEARLARAKKNKAAQERKQRNEQEKADRQQQQRLAEWSEGFHVVANQFEGRFRHRPAYQDLRRAIAAAGKEGGDKTDVAIFQGGRWVASVYFDGDRVKSVYRDETEGRSQF